MIRIFRVFIPVSVIILLISEVLLTVGAFVAAAFLNHPDPVAYLRFGNGQLNISLVVITIIVGMYLHDLYSDVLMTSHILLLQQLSFVLGVAFLIQGAVNYLNRDLRMPLHVMIPGSTMAVLGIYGWRVLFSSVVFKAMGGDRLLLVGNSPVLTEIAEHVATRPEQGLSIIGVITDDEEAGQRAKYLGSLDSLTEIAQATHPARIIVGMRERRNRVPVRELLNLRYKGYLIEEAAAAFERVCGRVCMKELRPAQLIYAGEFSRRRRAVFYQNATNMAAGTIGVALSLPLMALTALAVRLSSPGPILYRQKRVGMDGAPFTLYKFRSMSADAEAKTGAVWAQRNDPRITPVGRIIRKIRLDELPQLFNVLKGEMSIVGPRPERPEFVDSLAEQIPYYRHRHAVKPGITGWAQINYKYGDTIEDTITKLEYDLYYIKHMSLTLDLYIMFHTVKTMLVSRGAQ